MCDEITALVSFLFDTGENTVHVCWSTLRKVAEKPFSLRKVLIWHACVSFACWAHMPAVSKRRILERTLTQGRKQPHDFRQPSHG